MRRTFYLVDDTRFLHSATLQSKRREEVRADFSVVLSGARKREVERSHP